MFLNSESYSSVDTFNGAIFYMYFKSLESAQIKMCLTHRQLGKALVSLHIRAVSPELRLLAQSNMEFDDCSVKIYCI